MSALLPPLRCLTINANGLRSITKRATYFHLFATLNLHVIFLQETHHSSAEELEDWCRAGAARGVPFEGAAFGAHYTAAERGVAMLIARHSPLSHASLVCADPEGRFVVVKGMYGDQEVQLVNVYAPADSGDARCQFFANSLPPALSATPSTGALQLWAGDWNCVLGASDESSYGSGRRHQGGAELRTQLALHSMLDAQPMHDAVPCYTFTNAACHTRARLDRWYISAAWAAWASRVTVLDDFASDHRAVQLTIKPPAPPACGRGLWRLPLHLLNNESICQRLQGFIYSFFEERPVAADDYLGIAQRWASFKINLPLYLVHEEGVHKAQEHGVLRGLRAAVAFRRRGVLTAEAAPAADAAHAALRAALHELQQYHTDAAQRNAWFAETLWGDFGEKSTFYFHRLGVAANTLTAKRPIALLRDLELQHVVHDLSSPAGRDGAAATAVAFYTNLYSPVPHSPAARAQVLEALDRQLPQEEAEKADGPEKDGSITLECVKVALSACANGKAPGADGIPFEFYKLLWDALGGRLVEFYNAVYQLQPEQLLDVGLNAGVICLLPKSGDLTDISNYRPITLQNCDVKVLSRIIGDRMMSAANYLCDPTQSAFLAGRDIADNVLYHKLLFQHLTKTNSPGCLVFLDNVKAYDRILRDWVMECMAAMRFTPATLRWIDVLLSRSAASIMLNGRRTQPFHIASGVPQGNPLSPLLYILAVQPMAAYLRRRAAAGAFQCMTLPGGGGTAPPSQQYADDTSVLVGSRLHDLPAAMEAVATFNAASGAALNTAKCHGVEFGAAEPFEGIDQATGIPFHPPSTALKHLGVLLSTDPQRDARATFDKLLTNVLKSIAHWSRVRLSLLGRIHVAKQCVLSRVVYHCQFVVPPAEVVQHIVTATNAFVRGGMHKVLHPGMDILRMPVGEGGLGALDCSIHMQALHAKIVARYLHPAFHPWKLLFTWALHAFAPLHVHTAFAVTRVAARDEYLRQLLDAMRALRPHRIVDPAGMSAADVCCEHVLLNQRVRLAGHSLPLNSQLGRRLAAALAAAAGGAAVTADRRPICLGDVAPLICTQVPCALELAECLPLCWKLALQAAGGADVWRCTADRRHAVAPDGRWHLLAPDGRVGGVCEAVEGVDVAALEAVRAMLVPPGETVFLVLTGCPASPAVWGLGDAPLLHYTCKSAYQRLLRLQHAAVDDSYRAADTIRPPTWAPPGATAPAAGIQQLEAQWRASVQPSRPRGATQQQGATPPDGYVERWMMPAPPRPLARGGRAAANAAAEEDSRDALTGVVAFPYGLQDALTVQQAGGGQVEEPPTQGDGGGEGAAAGPQWHSAWRRAAMRALPADLRVFAFKLLHGRLFTNAYFVHTRARDASITADRALCAHSACNAEMEGLLHTFMHCSRAAPVIDWLRHLWEAVTGVLPPLCPALLLADDQRQWQPGTKHLQQLWTVLRLAVLNAIWTTRARTAPDGAVDPLRGAPPSAVVALAVRQVTRLLRMDYTRYKYDVRSLTVASSAWFAGRDPSITGDEFLKRWAHRGVLCSLDGDTLRVHLSATVPVAVVEELEDII